MEFHDWKQNLVAEVEDAAARCGERALADRHDPRNETAQQVLARLASELKTLPADHQGLTALYKEEQEFANLARPEAGEPEHRYRDAKEAILRSIGYENEPFETADQFLEVLRNVADETITEYRYRP